MSKTAVPGIVAAGMQPVWIIQTASLTDTITDDTETIPLTAVTGGQKADCYYDFGGLTLDRTATTRSRQRACQKVAEEIKIGETIAGTLTIVWDQQKLNAEPAAGEVDVNGVYKALPEGGQVYLFIAHGWDSDQDPTASTVGDLWRVRVSQIAHLLAASAEEDIMARADLAGDLFVPNVTLAA